MFYEVKTIAIDEVGKEVKEMWLVMAENIIDAIYKASEEAKTTEVESTKRSSIYEVINENAADKEERYTIEFSCESMDEKGKKKELKYKLFLYADSFDDAKAIAGEYLKQGYDGFKLSGLNSCSIVKYLG